MGTSRASSQGDRVAAATASQWLERLPEATPAERQEFIDWLKQSPLHVRELLLNEFVDHALSSFDLERKLPITLPAASSNVTLLSERIAPEATPARRTHRGRQPWFFSAAAALAAMFLMLLYFGSNGNANIYETGIGEQRTLLLDDGSLVTLNVRTRLEVNFKPEYRDLHLLAGQAIFTVAHDASRPFRVHVDDSTVTAIGTKFDVRRADGRTLVYVMEGRVRIEQPELMSLPVSPMELPRLAAVELTPGLSTVIERDGAVEPPANINVGSASAWQNRRLVFEERPLPEIAREFSSYVRTPTLVVEGPELASRLYTGSFDADRLDTFIEYLEHDASLKIVRENGRVIVRSADQDAGKP